MPEMADNETGTPPSIQNPRKRQSNSDTLQSSSVRPKRDKYTSVACDDCKKRKIKCSGGTTCQRCRNYNIQCLYTQSNTESTSQASAKRFASLEEQVAAMQSQINGLLVTIAEFQTHGGSSMQSGSPGQRLNSVGPVLPTTHRTHRNSPRSSDPKQPKFNGPTSSAFSFGVAKSSLESMGLQTEAMNGSSAVDSLAPTPKATPGPEEPEEIPIPAVDPLSSFTHDEICRLLEVYKEELGPIYPFIQVENIAEFVQSIFRMYDKSQSAHGISTDEILVNDFDEKDVRLLKMMLASALVIEGLGQSDLGLQLFESVEYATSRILRVAEVDLKELQILTITSIYHFHCDDEILAWRKIGFAARMCLEMGLHRKESLWQQFPEIEDRTWATQLFWCVYVLDRRWSFGTGMPFALQDPDIDPEIPEPDERVPYLRCLVAYGKICSSVWKAVTAFDLASLGASKDTVAYLDFQIQQWVQSIPPDLQMLHPRLGPAAENQPRTLQRLRVLLYVRGNQMRTLIHRQYLLSATRIMENLSGAQLVVDIAKDTIRVLAHLNETSNIYHRQQTAFNYFLVSALAAIFLAACHAPAKFSHSCRDEFYIALNLVRGFSSRSFSSKRLWKSVRGLKLIAPRLGLLSDDQTVSRDSMDGQLQQTDNGAVDATGLPPLPNGNLRFAPRAPYPAGFWSTDDMNTKSGDLDVFQMSYDLTHFYEALGQSEEGLKSGGNVQGGISHFNLNDDFFSFEGSGGVSRLFEGLF